MRKWKIIRMGDNVPPGATKMISYDCQHCGKEAELPVKGTAIAQLAGGGVVFDPGPRHMPSEIRCPSCRWTFGLEAA